MLCLCSLGFANIRGLEFLGPCFVHSRPLLAFPYWRHPMDNNRWCQELKPHQIILSRVFATLKYLRWLWSDRPCMSCFTAQWSLDSRRSFLSFALWVATQLFWTKKCWLFDWPIINWTLTWFQWTFGSISIFSMTSQTTFSKLSTAFWSISSWRMKRINTRGLEIGAPWSLLSR